jgi:rare lipoprotein A
MNKYIYTTILSTMLLAGCSSNGPLVHSWGEYADQNTENALYRVEEPYEIKGVVYTPAEQTEYSEKGLASWYMPAGDSALTANGEIYDVNIPSARHKTLPLPSIIKITNLENDKSVIARVNDRGPMVNNRLIDVSQSAARELGMPVSGTVLVQVDLMPEESSVLKQQLVQAGRVYQSGIVPKQTSDVLSSDQTQTEVLYDGTKEVIPANGPKVQLGCFANHQNALRLQNKLSQFPVQIKQIQKGDKILSVVKVGPYADKAQAKQILQQLKQQGYQDAYITK